MDAAFWAFKDEVAELPQEEQQELWAEILAESGDDDEGDDDDNHSNIRPPKGLRSPTSVMKAARKQFTDLVSLSNLISHCRLLKSIVGIRILHYGRCPYLRGPLIHR